MDSGAQNAIVGELDEPTRIPETQVPEQSLEEERKLAKYSQSQEFKRLQKFLEARIQFYQGFLPDGRPIDATPVKSEDWRVANAIIKEFNLVLSEYENARQVVKENG